MLKNYHGIVQTDGYVSYGDGDYIHPKNKKRKAEVAVRLIDKAMELEGAAREEKYDDERLMKMRREQLLPL